VVTRVDRLARSIRDLQDIVHELRERGVTLKATEQPIDTRTASGKAFEPPRVCRRLIGLCHAAKAASCN
jgi:DNA invertase Pin-like site-specific DNA recombinase